MSTDDRTTDDALTDEALAGEIAANESTPQDTTGEAAVDADSDHEGESDHDTESEHAAAPTGPNADIPSLSYEQAREELVGIVTTLERGDRPLEESMTLWERGEALADHCARWLDDAQQRITQRVEARQAAQPAEAPEA